MNFLHITTQHMEDYNFDDESQPYFKFKGGETFVIHGANPRRTDVAELLQRFRGCVEYSGGFQSFIRHIDWVDSYDENCTESLPPIDVVDMGDHFLFTQAMMELDWETDSYVLPEVITWKQVAGSSKRLELKTIIKRKAA